MLLGIAGADSRSNSLGVFTRMIDYMTSEGVLQEKDCGLIQQQGDVCFTVYMATASEFSEVLDDTLDVFHGLGLVRSKWVSGNGVWSTRIVHQAGHEALEVFVAERTRYGAQFLEGVFFLR